MNIKPIETIQMKQPIIKRIKNAFNSRLANLKELVSDVFEREKPKYLIIDGKKINERDLPNCVSGPSDWDGVKIKKIVLDPEDVKRLEKLPQKEYIEERWKLIKAGKYREEDW